MQPHMHIRIYSLIYLYLSIYLRVFILCVLDINIVDQVVLCWRGGGAVLHFAPAMFSSAPSLSLDAIPHLPDSKTKCPQTWTDFLWRANCLQLRITNESIKNNEFTLIPTTAIQLHKVHSLLSVV